VLDEAPSGLSQGSIGAEICMPRISIVIGDRKLDELVRVRVPLVEADDKDARQLLIVELTDDPTGKGAAAVRTLHAAREGAFVIAVSSICSSCVTQQAVRLHIDDFFQLPRELSDFEGAVSARLKGLEPPAKTTARSSLLRGKSRQTESLRKYVDRVALTDASVLITGETGTGKELVAETIHRHGARHAGPFVSVNSAALPDTLFESEMFGYERGAFTGAQTRQAGKLRSADAGTIFFDEVGEIGLTAQAKLLRALETREVTPLGGVRGYNVDVRVVAATNRDLESMTRAGSFRADLFYRLNVVRIELSPLRERPEDIPELVAHFVEHFNKQLGRRASFDTEALALLACYGFPGNVRELRNIVECSFINSSSDWISALELPARVRGLDSQKPARSDREALLHALTSTNWNISQTATHLQCSRMTIYRKLAEFNLSRADAAEKQSTS
jgi:DNA-binding NtrC family response regulator